MAQNVVYEIYVYNGRTSRTDKNIQKLMEELAHITDELKQVTPDDIRENFVINIQIWINILFSYWVTFPDHTLDAKELYVLELNTKNLSKEIQYLQNRALQEITAVLEDTAISQESRNLQEAYQEAMFGQDELQQEEDEKDFAEWEMEDTRGFLLNSPISKLPFTEFEAEVVAESFSCKGKSAEVICGGEANKNNVFTHQTDVLHFATHGFTMPMRSESAEDEDYAESPYGKRLKRIADSCNPFLRCGLLLAGVDNWLRGTEADGFGNGLLTGLDILAENLEGYKLAVLSVCDTGDGQISCIGNGIEGLRSAFELADVPVLLCTLWSVDDFATALFMEAFYGQLHASGKPFGHPRYWAGFILHGAVLEK